MAKKRAGKRGPKPKPPEELRTDSLRVMLTPAEKSRIEDAAKLAKRGLSDYVRVVLLGDAERRISEAM